MADIKTPFSDAIEKSPVPTKGSSSGTYGGSEVPGGPSRTGGAIPELHRDNIAGSPSTSGPLNTPFKDKVG